MLNKIDIRNIKMDWLCSRCLMRISNYAKLAHDYDGTVIEIQSEEVLGQIRDHVVNLDNIELKLAYEKIKVCLLYTSPSPRDRTRSRMPSSA